MESSEALLREIQARNRRVEIDKAWETSKTRLFAIMVITYIVAVIFLWAIGAPRAWVSAGMPVIGYVLSTLSLPIIKTWWIKQHNLQ